MSKKILIISIIIVVTGYFWYKSRGDNTLTSDVKETPTSVSGQNVDRNIDILKYPKIYTSPDGKFTFNYPDGFKITDNTGASSASAEGTIVPGKILVESGQPNKGFEITIIPFDEPGPLTAERIHQDLPNLEISKFRNIDISSVSALAFDSKDDSIGDTSEIWFTHNGSLYQAQTYRSFSPEMEEILKTLKFK